MLISIGLYVFNVVCAARLKRMAPMERTQKKNLTHYF